MQNELNWDEIAAFLLEELIMYLKANYTLCSSSWNPESTLSYSISLVHVLKQVSALGNKHVGMKNGFLANFGDAKWEFSTKQALNNSCAMLTPCELSLGNSEVLYHKQLALC